MSEHVEYVTIPIPGSNWVRDRKVRFQANGALVMHVDAYGKVRVV